MRGEVSHFSFRILGDAGVELIAADRIAVPLNAWNLAVERANTRLVALPGCGHAMIPEQLEAISRSVVGFLQEAGSKPVTTPFKT